MAIDFAGRPTALVEALHTSLEATARALLQTALGVEPGFPVTTAQYALDVALAGPGVIVQTNGAATIGSEAPWLWLDAAFAAALVDRALGGEGRVGAAHPSYQLSDAELGVLAYLLGRWLGAASLDLRIVAVSACMELPTKLRDALAGGVVVPFALQLGGEAGAARVLLPDAPPVGAANPWSSQGVRIAARLEIAHDSLSEADLAALAPGDVLVSDHITALAAEGRALGGATLRLGHGPAQLGVQLTDNVLRPGPIAPAPEARERADGGALEATLALALAPRSAATLAALAAGTPCSIAASELEHVQLFVDGKLRARGGLVRVANRLGFQAHSIA